jgi:hypothetical protein
MSILQTAGIQFGLDSSVLNSFYGIIPKNSSMLFFQSSAPSGWTKSTSHNNKALRVVSGTGGGFGSGGVSGPGGSPFTSILTSRSISGSVTASGTVQAHTLTVQQIPSHSHNAGSAVNVSPGSPGHPFRAVNSQAPAGGATGFGGSHTHPFSGGSSPISASADLRVQYIDVIVCSLN